MGNFNIDYTGKDYDSLLAKADEFAKSIIPEWTSRDDNDINWATVKTVAYLVSLGMFYIDLGVNEQDPFEVQIMKNAIRIARKFGMPVKRYSGALADLTVTITDAASADRFVIYRGEVIKYGGQEYVVTEEVVYPSGVKTRSVPVQYGKFERNSLGTSDGSAFQSFKLPYTDIQDRAVRVFITEDGKNEYEWFSQHTLLMSSDTDKHFRLILNEDSMYEVHFGDGVCGRVPIAGATLEYEIIRMPIEYASTNYGNIPAGNINLSTNPSVKTVLQETDATGGGAGDTAAQIGRKIPQWISTSERCVAPKDYEYLACIVPNVKSAKAIQTAMVVNVYIIAEYGLATPTLQTKVREYLSARKFEHVTVNTLVPVKVAIDVTVDVEVADNKLRNIVKASVADTLKQLLNKPNEIGFKLTLLTLFGVLSDIPELKNGTVTALFRHGGTPVNTDLQLNVNEVPIPGTITVNATGGIV